MIRETETVYDIFALQSDLHEVCHKFINRTPHALKPEQRERLAEELMGLVHFYTRDLS